MLLYITTFIISILSGHIAQCFENNKFARYFYSAISIGSLVILAGCRDITIGSDTIAYPMTVYKNASNYEFSLVGLIEPLYGFLGYIVYTLDGGFNMLLFITHLIIVSAFYIGFWRLKNQVPIYMCMFLFCFLFFNMSLQISRQAIAVSLVFLGFTYLKEKQLKIFLFFIVLATLFHKSSLMAVLIIPFVFWKKTKFEYIIIITCILMIFLYDYTLSHVALLQGLDKLEAYGTGEDYKGKLSYSEFILRLFFLSFLFFKADSKHVLLMFISELLINLLQIKSRFVGRAGMYLYILYFYYIPLYMKKSKMFSILFNRWSIISFVIFYWWFVYIYGNAGDTYPYSSKILESILL